MKLPSGETAGGWATVFALLLTAYTSWSTNRAQDEFNRKVLEFNQGQLKAMNEGLTLQLKAAEINERSAKAQREAAAVNALGRYLNDSTGSTKAWESAEAIIDMVGDDDAWRATARRAIKLYPKQLNGLECELYSPAFLDFAAETFHFSSAKEMCKQHAKPKP
jgi:hypothetical protein